MSAVMLLVTSIALAGYNEPTGIAIFALGTSASAAS